MEVSSQKVKEMIWCRGKKWTIGGALPLNSLVWRVTRGSWFEVLSGHLASEHVQLGLI